MQLTKAVYNARVRFVNQTAWWDQRYKIFLHLEYCLIWQCDFSYQKKLVAHSWCSVICILFVLGFMMEEGFNTSFDTCGFYRGIFGVLTLTFCMLLLIFHTQRNSCFGGDSKYISLLQENLSSLFRSSLKPEIWAQGKSRTFVSEKSDLNRMIWTALLLRSSGHVGLY